MDAEHVPRRMQAVPTESIAPLQSTPTSELELDAFARQQAIEYKLPESTRRLARLFTIEQSHPSLNSISSVTPWQKSALAFVLAHQLAPIEGRQALPTEEYAARLTDYLLAIPYRDETLAHYKLARIRSNVLTLRRRIKMLPSSLGVTLLEQLAYVPMPDDPRLPDDSWQTGRSFLQQMAGDFVEHQPLIAQMNISCRAALPLSGLDRHEESNIPSSQQSLAAEAAGELATTETADMDNDAIMNILGIYRRQVGKPPLLSQEQEAGLAKAIEAGVLAKEKLEDIRNDPEVYPPQELAAIVAQGELAQQKLILANLPLVIDIAQKNILRGVPLLDLIQEGNLDLIKAIQRFDYTKNIKFSTFATPSIWGSIARAVNQQRNTIYLPEHIPKHFTALAAARRKLAGQGIYHPTKERLAQETELTKEQVHLALLGHRVQPRSLHERLSEYGPELGEVIVVPSEEPDPLEQVYSGQLRQVLDQALDVLSERNKQVLLDVFGFNNPEGKQLTHQEVADIHGIKRQRVEQIIKYALAKLRSEFPDLSQLLEDI
ncbi:MAG TPA: sigma-70 family RNA polymerase sigma factor [Nevskiaceae bacterium]|nr:sigma-70 family RNA polymerase sigma factor [Nevskiaceae bacterium]